MSQDIVSLVQSMTVPSRLAILPSCVKIKELVCALASFVALPHDMSSDDDVALPTELEIEGRDLRIKNLDWWSTTLRKDRQTFLSRRLLAQPSISAPCHFQTLRAQKILDSRSSETWFVDRVLLTRLLTL
jgi:hypothetical protein